MPNDFKNTLSEIKADVEPSWGFCAHAALERFVRAKIDRGEEREVLERGIRQRQSG